MLSETDVAKLMKSHLNAAPIPRYDENAITVRAATLASKPRANRRFLIPVILLALIIPALGLGLTERGVISSAMFVFRGPPNLLKAITIQTHRLTFVQGCPYWGTARREQMCMRRLRAWLSRLPSKAPFTFVSPRGLPSGASPCGYMFDGELYGITYCRPGSKPTRREFTIAFIRYQPGVYERGAISTIRSPDFSMSWRPKYQPQIHLWIVGNELVMVNVFDSTLSETQAARIQRAMHGLSLPNT